MIAPSWLLLSQQTILEGLRKNGYRVITRTVCIYMYTLASRWVRFRLHTEATQSRTGPIIYTYMFTPPPVATLLQCCIYPSSGPQYSLYTTTLLLPDNLLYTFCLRIACPVEKGRTYSSLQFSAHWLHMHIYICEQIWKKCVCNHTSGPVVYPKTASLPIHSQDGRQQSIEAIPADHSWLAMQFSHMCICV